MAEQIFSQSRHKIMRAEMFILELDEKLKSLSEPMEMRGAVDRTTIPWKVVGEELANSPMPGLIIGDIVHNLRTSLDLMAAELARINKKSDKDVYFPFAPSEDKFEEAVKRKSFNRCGDDAVSMLRTFAPYKGGNDALRALHDLDIQDKHTALILASIDVRFEIKGQYGLVEPYNDSMSIVATRSQFKFPDGTVLAGNEVIKTLKELMELVNSIIQAFTALVEARA